VVREFYANMVEGPSSSYVRGHYVPFDSQTKNNFYDLPNFDSDGYNTYISDHLDVNQVIQTLCRPGA
jgi:hypothetical protein